jgi:hypothetical protein
VRRVALAFLPNRTEYYYTPQCLGWVTWELETAIERGKLIVAMAAQGVSRVILPIPIRNKGVPFYSWNPSKLKTYLDHAPVVG